MSGAERVEVVLPANVADELRTVVDSGEYSSAAEVIREALRDWTIKRAVRAGELAALKAEIAVGLADIEAGRLVEYDEARIVELGRQLSASRSRSS